MFVGKWLKALVVIEQQKDYATFHGSQVAAEISITGLEIVTLFTLRLRLGLRDYLIPLFLPVRRPSAPTTYGGKSQSVNQVLLGTAALKRWGDTSGSSCRPTAQYHG